MERPIGDMTPWFQASGDVAKIPALEIRLSVEMAPGMATTLLVLVAMGADSRPGDTRVAAWTAARTVKSRTI